MRSYFLAVAMVLLCGASSAVVKHFSFAPRQTGFVNGPSVVVPVPKKVADAYDKAMEQQAEKELAIIGKVTKVESGDTLYVTPTGGFKSKVRLSRVIAPKGRQYYAAESLKALKDLVNGKKVTVKYRAKDKSGTVFGIVWLDKEEINLKLLKSGAVVHNSKSDKTQSYIDAQQEAKLAKRGVWLKGVELK